MPLRRAVDTQQYRDAKDAPSFVKLLWKMEMAKNLQALFPNRCLTGNLKNLIF